MRKIRSAAASLLLLGAFLTGQGYLAGGAENSQTSIAIEALSRLKDIDLDANPGVKAAVMRVIDSTKGTPQFVDLVRDFKLKDQDPALLDYAMDHPGESAAADALRLVLANQNIALIERALRTPNATKILEPLGNTGEKLIVPLLEPLVTDQTQEAAVRQRAVQALVKMQDGAMAVLKLAQQGRLPEDLKILVSSELHGVRWANIKSEAAQVLPLPQGRNAEPLPPMAELAGRKGDAVNGEKIFFSPQVNCGSCHQVNGKGVDFGPRLSEIGTKLGKDALFLSILDPNAGISFGYETWQLQLKNGDEAYGLLASETEGEVVIKAPGAIVTRYQKTTIEKRDKLATSTMPTGLQQAMTVQEFVDLVEFLTSLKKASP